MACLKKSDRIFVAGHRGLVGSAIVRTLRQKGYENIIVRTRNELDLLDQRATLSFFETQRPDVVFVAAAKVGGILANNTQRADFIFENLQIQNNVIWSAFRSGAHRLVFLGSSCIYPKHAPQPMEEEHLLTGPLEPTNQPYALAKIAGLELVNALRHQHGCDYFSVMPTNLYGPGDNYDLENSHVLPALLRKVVMAAHGQASEFVVWGSGSPLREFLYSEDCADAIVFLAENVSKEALASSWIGKAGLSHVNVGSGEEVSIRQLAETLVETIGFPGALRFDSSHPDGTPRKLLSTRFLREAGWAPSVTLKEGIRRVLASLRSSGEMDGWLHPTSRT